MKKLVMKYYNTPLMVEIDYFRDNLKEINFILDLIIFAKQNYNQKSIDVYIDEAKVFYKYNITLDIPFEENLENNDIFFLYDEDTYTNREKKFFYYISFTQNISFDEISFICSISNKDSRKDYPNLEKNDCNAFSEPDSKNSFILVILDKYSYYDNIYNTITIIKKKEQFSNDMKFSIIKKYIEDKETSLGVHRIKIDNSYPLIFEFKLYFEIFRL